MIKPVHLTLHQSIHLDRLASVACNSRYTWQLDTFFANRQFFWFNPHLVKNIKV